MKKILVFGASGDTGRYFIDYFKKNYSGNEYEIVAIGTRSTSYFNDIGVDYYSVDISKKENFMPRFIKFVIFISIFLNSNNNLFTLNPSLN